MIGNEGAQVLAAALARKTDQQVDATRDRILTNLIKEELQTMIIDEVRFAAVVSDALGIPADAVTSVSLADKDGKVAAALTVNIPAAAPAWAPRTASR